MGKINKTINLHVKDPSHAIAVMEELEKSGLTVEATFWPGNLRAVVSGDKEVVRKLELRLRGALKQKFNKPEKKG